jgi:hypothetical protein
MWQMSAESEDQLKKGIKSAIQAERLNFVKLIKQHDKEQKWNQESKNSNNF